MSDHPTFPEWYTSVDGLVLPVVRTVDEVPGFDPPHGRTLHEVVQGLLVDVAERNGASPEIAHRAATLARHEMGLILSAERMAVACRRAAELALVWEVDSSIPPCA